MSVETIITTYGYPAVLLATFFEGETALIIAGFLADCRYLSLPWVMFSAFLGAFAGDQLYFFIGRTRGTAFLSSRPRWQERVDRIHRVLERYQTAVMLGFRFVYGFRIATPFVIGLTGFSWVRFMILNAIGAGLWAVTIAGAGFLFGRAIETILGDVRKYEIALILVIVAAAVLLFAFHRKNQRRGC